MLLYMFSKKLGISKRCSQGFRELQNGSEKYKGIMGSILPSIFFAVFFKEIKSMLILVIFCIIFS